MAPPRTGTARQRETPEPADFCRQDLLRGTKDSTPPANQLGVLAWTGGCPTQGRAEPGMRSGGAGVKSGPTAHADSKGHREGGPLNAHRGRALLLGKDRVMRG